MIFRSKKENTPLAIALNIAISTFFPQLINKIEEVWDCAETGGRSPGIACHF